MIFVGIESPRGASLRETNKTQNMREDIVTSIHRIQAAGIEVMAGMIVGFDNDDASICDEQFRFIQEARIPISMTGMLNAVPKTALHARLKAAGRLIADLVGDQSVFTNIVPSGMSRDDLAVLARIIWHCVLRASPRRAWLTLSLCLETAWRRPRPLREAFTLALMHKHFYEYARTTSRQLEALIHDLRGSEPVERPAST